MPFTYEDGLVSDVTGQFITITTSGTSDTTCYEIPSGLYLKYGVNDAVEKFHVLTSGVTLADYNLDLPTTSGLMDVEGEASTFDVYTQRLGGSRPSYFITESLQQDLVVGVASLPVIKDNES